MKIALSILEFYMDAPLFNPNDEFGPDSLYLCSKVRKSFGFSYFLDGKLLNYDHVYTARELKQLLSNRTCERDQDCFFTDECITKCVENKCSEYLIQPQLVVFCEFAKDYLYQEIYHGKDKTLFELIEECVKLKSLYVNSGILYGKLNSTDKKIAEDRKAYIDYSIEYSIFTYKLHHALWNEIRLLPTPVRQKLKLTKKSQPVRDFIGFENFNPIFRGFDLARPNKF
jgi:hypothetical protein